MRNQHQGQYMPQQDLESKDRLLLAMEGCNSIGAQDYLFCLYKLESTIETILSVLSSSPRKVLIFTAWTEGSVIIVE